MMTLRLTKKNIATATCPLKMQMTREINKANFGGYISIMDMILKKTLVLPVQPDIITMEMTSI